MDAGIFDVFGDGVGQDPAAVGDGVEFELLAALDERTDDHGMLGRDFDGHLQESMEVGQ